jgi:hypothetical protein
MTDRSIQRAFRHLPRRGLLSLLPALALAACGHGPPRQDQVQLPETARTDGLTDPTRSAILSASYVFAQPASIAGNAAEGAEALARLEYLAVELDVGPRWIGMDPLVPLALAQGRAEARAAFGFDPAAPPQRAMDALYGAAAALRAGDGDRAIAALTPLTGAQGAAPALARLAAFPNLPRATEALARARNGMNRMDRDGDRPRQWRS